jgi:hypothetical protein
MLRFAPVVKNSLKLLVHEHHQAFPLSSSKKNQAEAKVVVVVVAELLVNHVKETSVHVAKVAEGILVLNLPKTLPLKEMNLRENHVQQESLNEVSVQLAQTVNTLPVAQFEVAIVLREAVSVRREAKRQHELLVKIEIIRAIVLRELQVHRVAVIVLCEKIVSSHLIDQREQQALHEAVIDQFAKNANM